MYTILRNIAKNKIVVVYKNRVSQAPLGTYRGCYVCARAVEPQPLAPNGRLTRHTYLDSSLSLCLSLFLPTCSQFTHTRRGLPSWGKPPTGFVEALLSPGVVCWGQSRQNRYLGISPSRVSSDDWLACWLGYPQASGGSLSGERPKQDLAGPRAQAAPQWESISGRWVTTTATRQNKKRRRKY